MRRIWLTEGRGRLLALTLAAASILPFTAASAAVGASPSAGVVDAQQVEIEGTASALQLGNAFAAVADAVRPAVVFIMVETVTTGLRMPPAMPTSLRGAFAGAFPRATTSSGTGFIVLSNGYIVTNHHVIDGARRVLVRLFDGREYEAEIVGEDALSDIAVLRIDETNLPTASLGGLRPDSGGRVGPGHRQPHGQHADVQRDGGDRERDRPLHGPGLGGGVHPDRRRGQPRQLGGPACGPSRTHHRHELRHPELVRILPGVHLGHPGQPDPPGGIGADRAGTCHTRRPGCHHLASDRGGRSRGRPRHGLWRRGAGRGGREQPGVPLWTPTGRRDRRIRRPPRDVRGPAATERLVQGTGRQRGPEGAPGSPHPRDRDGVSGRRENRRSYGFRAGGAPPA